MGPKIKRFSLAFVESINTIYIVFIVVNIKGSNNLFVFGFLDVYLFAEACVRGGKLGLEVLVLVVDAGQGLAVEHGVVPTVVDPGAVLHTLQHICV